MSYHSLPPPTDPGAVARNFFRTCAAPIITYTFAGSSNEAFKKTLRYEDTVYWHDTNEYVGLFVAKGVWNGRRFKQKFYFRRNRGGLQEVTRRAVKYFG